MRVTCLPPRREADTPGVTIFGCVNILSQTDPASRLPPHSWEAISICKNPIMHTISDSPTSCGYLRWHFFWMAYRGQSITITGPELGLQNLLPYLHKHSMFLHYHWCCFSVKKHRKNTHSGPWSNIIATLAKNPEYVTGISCNSPCFSARTLCTCFSQAPSFTALL